MKSWVVDGPARWRVQRGHLSDSDEPILVIDDFSEQPDAWVKFAATRPFRKLAPYYPGVRSEVSQDYLKLHLPPLLPLVADVFGCSAGVRPTECFFSMVTDRPETLAPLQRMPHIDGGGDDKLALLHYLCHENQGGTAFYRHRSSGRSRIPAAEFGAYETALERDVAAHGLPVAAYPRGSSELFEKTGACPAAYNRAVIYRGINLHAIDIPADFDFDPRPGHGRLTINTFLLPA
ncbi:MAG: DUF6445 family protein [Pseudomonadota bacterium]